jgi:hypothetical protein
VLRRAARSSRKADCFAEISRLLFFITSKWSRNVFAGLAKPARSIELNIMDKDKPGLELVND